MKLKGINAIYENESENPSLETWLTEITYGNLKKLQASTDQRDL